MTRSGNIALILIFVVLAIYDGIEIKWWLGIIIGLIPLWFIYIWYEEYKNGRKQ